MKTLRLALLCGTAAALLAAADASAQTVSSSFDVSAVVAAKCVIDSAADINITDTATPYDPTGGVPPPVTGDIVVRCTRGTSYEIVVNGGVATGTMARVGEPAETLPFRLYDDTCAADLAAATYTSLSRAAKTHTICAGIDATALTAAGPKVGDYSTTVDLGQPSGRWRRCRCRRCSPLRP